MAIVASDLHVRLTAPAASSGNATAQAAPSASLGKYASTTDLVDNTLHNLFDAISGDENAAGTTDYRCVYLYNANATNTWYDPKVWLGGYRCTAVGATDLVTSSGHGLTANEAVRVEAELAGDALPSGLTNSATYYVKSPATDTFQLSATAGGAAVDIGDSSGFATRRHGTTQVAIAVDVYAATAVGATGLQAQTVASETTAPTGLTWGSGTTKAAGLALGDIGPGSGRAVWVRRTATNSAARDWDGCVVSYQGDTAQ